MAVKGVDVHQTGNSKKVGILFSVREAYWYLEPVKRTVHVVVYWPVFALFGPSCTYTGRLFLGGENEELKEPPTSGLQ